MRRLALFAIALVTVVGTACSSSHTGDEDAAIVFDAAVLPDTGPEPGELCGNGNLNVGEMCDDGNTTSGDGCDSMCRREGYCGDNMPDTGEACDDGNNRSGDGCRSDCLSDESCGNGIVDFAAGEICDGTPMCDPTTCAAVTGCGDGTVTSPEVCDDSNTLAFDGCDAACREEIAMVISSLGLGSRSQGCDLDGSPGIDNAFARALGVLGSALGPLISMAIESGDLTLLLGFLGLDDPLGANDDDLRVAWLQGQDADGDVSNNFGGAGQFWVDPGSINPDGSPTTSVQAQIASNALTGGPETIPLPLPIPIELQQGHVQGTTVADAGQLYQIEDGLLCGGVPVSLLALLGGFLGGTGGMLETDPPCDGGAEASLVDLIIAGGSATANFGGTMFPLTFAATAPDLDLDADGLEGFVIQDTGPDGCQPVVVACIDGDGTRIDGRDCYTSPEIGDGYSAAFTFTAISATLVPMPPAP